MLVTFRKFVFLYIFAKSRNLKFLVQHWFATYQEHIVQYLCNTNHSLKTFGAVQFYHSERSSERSNAPQLQLTLKRILYSIVQELLALALVLIAETLVLLWGNRWQNSNFPRVPTNETTNLQVTYLNSLCLVAKISIVFLQFLQFWIRAAKVCLYV